MFKKSISILVWNLSTNDGFLRAFLLKNALEKLGYQIEILGFKFGNDLYKAIPKNLKIKVVEGGNYPGFWKSINKLLTYIEGDIVYAIKPQPASFGVALLKKLFTKRPIILDVDDWEMSWHEIFFKSQP